ncbi:dolichol phosphate-mannose biosynthesis regulatory protein-like [Ylistrum balloti]|uniref:dolichol phosphate-mannose biosynthesis regulatory protein-like n=1 Tax=Ylistrum balloti TaxID=509963 RepID=UPI002905EB41|nr:dolichol phosphate-mannose biosynthesis regulatory protein-like [Ylistrum balloti]
MATGTDQALGWGLVGFSMSIFIYYTAWIIILPFIDEGQLIHSFFMPRIYALVIPLSSGVLGLLVIGLFVGVTMLKSTQKEKTS